VVGEAVERPIEREYRSIISDNLRWREFTFRPGDIFVCTPPKCGTTWMQTIVASLLFPDGNAPGPVLEIAPWIDARFNPLDEVIGRLEAQTFRRSIKTHTAADGIPWYPAGSYVVVGRDGRDAFMSFLNHIRGLRPETMSELATSAIAEGIDLGTDGPPPVDDVHEFFSWWLYKDAHWFGHVSSFWEHRREPNVLFVHYNDMQADLDGQMRRVGDFLGIDLRPEQWPSVVERCTFSSMKARSDEIADFDRLFVGGADTFLYKASNGRWHDVLTPEELAAFDRRSRELLPPDAIAWTQSGISALDV
jgi:aryl sulfotransferase